MMSDPYTYTSRLLDAAKQGNLAEVERLLPLVSSDKQRGEALVHAVRGGHMETVCAIMPSTTWHLAAVEEAVNGGHAYLAYFSAQNLITETHL